jgi:hypothetical protein
MAFAISSTSEYDTWFRKLDEEVQARILTKVAVLAEVGPLLRRPTVGKVKESSFPNMKELVVQVGGRPYRIFFLFGSTRSALLLLGGVKDGDGDKDFYDRMIPQVDALVKKYKWK